MKYIILIIYKCVNRCQFKSEKILTNKEAMVGLKYYCPFKYHYLI